MTSGVPNHSGRASAEGAAALGLVSSLTSDKDPSRELTIDRFQSRYKRLRKNVLTSERLLRATAERRGFRYFLAMLTLTYAPGIEWQPYHITEIQKRIRAWLAARGHRYCYVWVCELQQRGAPHYHVLIWIPRGLRLPKPDSFGWWPHGMSNIQKVERGGGYLAKYLSKMGDGIHRFRKGQRTHGSGGLDVAASRERRWWMAPKYVRDLWPSWQSNVSPAKGGGWVARITGEWVPSPWRLVSFGAMGVVVRWIAGPAIGVFSEGWTA